MHVRARNSFALDGRHVAIDASAPRCSLFVMGMRLDCGGARPVRRSRSVAFEAQLLRGLAKLRVVAGAVRVMTVGTSDSSTVHHALNEVVPLHPVLVRRTVGKIVEVGLAENVLFELPEIRQFEPHLITNGP